MYVIYNIDHIHNIFNESKKHYLFFYNNDQIMYLNFRICDDFYRG